MVDLVVKGAQWRREGGSGRAIAPERQREGRQKFFSISFHHQIMKEKE
jgi:hypothetical protein